MITEFTCGRYTATYLHNRWIIKLPLLDIANITPDGAIIRFNTSINETSIDYTADAIIEIAALMNNIKRQYKQLNHD